jgi:hypothetical protein
MHGVDCADTGRGRSTWQVYLQFIQDNQPKIGVYLQRTHAGLDARPATMTWFQMYCFTHKSCYMLSSRPDTFQVMQSWG